MNKRTAIDLDKSIKLSIQLQEELRLTHENWHQLKNDSDRRAAELLASGLAQLLQGGDKADIEALLAKAIQWIKREVRDAGCPKNH